MAAEKGREERRKHPRFAKKISIQINDRSLGVLDYGKKDSGARAAEVVMGKDISEGGLCFFSRIPYEVKAVLGLIIRISDLDQVKRRLPLYLAVSSIPIAAEGEVVRCQPMADGSGYEVGVRFVDIFEDDYKILMGGLGE
ncbi:PilZ domain-containing protein [Desulfatibacillum alkenivorans DSM 16219]|uniref:PilZ domain-containing protein n=1 Tax=Desulfatibacillum alkenivorans DSM 16219 TaxID=1121393 RepID=A0A1M7AEX2_9BACT|nr:PilZ domain-containing protein [Desulfatibacillum alkenivorans]SHL41166.1 PilZ domain-containing protein [Desulfatibacillum alkenivorans DSM 16219]